MALMATEEGAGTGEVVALAGARVGRLLYMPSALLAAHLPAGLGGMLRVPRLMEMEADDDAARLEAYIVSIRRTARVFEVNQSAQATLERNDSHMVWVNSWASLSRALDHSLWLTSRCAARLDMAQVPVYMLSGESAVGYLVNMLMLCTSMLCGMVLVGITVPFKDTGGGRTSYIPV